MPKTNFSTGTIKLNLDLDLGILHSLTEPNMLVVRPALAEEQVMRRSQEEIRDVEDRVEALLLPLESCFNLQQGKMGHVKVLALH